MIADIGHWCKMDYQFNSVNLACAAYDLEKKVLIHGNIQKHGSTVPPLVVQEEVNEKQAAAVHGTVKAAVLKNDRCLSNLIIASCYDQKSFYIILHSMLQVSWIKCSKQTWNHQRKKVIDFKCLK